MAWVTVSGSNSVWQYVNSATAANTYSDATGSYSGGVRSYTRPGTGTVEQIYVRTRKTGETTERGELSKTYYDNQ